MIAKDQIIPVLIEASPVFVPTWEAFLAEWKGEPELPLYILLSDIADCLIESLARERTEFFPAIFAAIERLHLEGDSYVKEAATIGLLEPLQNLNLHKTTNPEQFRPYLGPESLRWWEKLYRLWQQGEMLTDD